MAKKPKRQKAIKRLNLSDHMIMNTGKAGKTGSGGVLIPISL